LDGVARELRHVDHLGARKLVLELGDATLVVRLRLLGGVVFRIFRQIAVRAGIGNLLDDARPLDLLAVLELVLERRIARCCHRDLIHLPASNLPLQPRDNNSDRGPKFRPATRPKPCPKHVPSDGRPRFPGWDLAGEIALQRTHLEVAPEISFDSLRCGDGPRKSGVVWHFMQEGCPPQRTAIGTGRRHLGGIETQLDPAVFDGVDDMGSSFQDLVDLAGGKALFGEIALGAGGGDDLEPERQQKADRLEHARLVGVPHRHQHRAPARPPRSRPDTTAWPGAGTREPPPIWLLAKAMAKLRSMPITSPVDFISGPSTVSTPGKRANGKTASLTPIWSNAAGLRSKLASISPAMIRAAILATGTPITLATKGTVREARGLTSRTWISPSLMAYWTFIRPTTFKAS